VGGPAGFLEQLFYGMVVTYVHLCGHRFAPIRDPRRYPVWAKCPELRWAMLVSNSLRPSDLLAGRWLTNLLR
jgi:hypothetical protein